MATRPFAFALIFSISIAQTNVALADFRVVTKPAEPTAPAINYAAPIAASKPLAGSFSAFARSKPTITEIGNRTDLAQPVTSGISSFGETFASLLQSVVPSRLELNISKDTDVSIPLKLNIKSGTPWVRALKKLLAVSNNFAVINWNSSSVTIGSNSERNIKSIVKSSTKEVTGNGDTYIIRKKSDDLTQRKSAGYIVKDGKVIRFDADSNGGD